MLHPWHDLPAGPTAPEAVNVVVEIPKRSRNKYELDKNTGMFKLDRVLYSAVYYPGDYGFIPQTLSEDGDPCDGMVLIKEPTFTGCMIEVRPIGMLRMIDGGEEDTKILAVPCHDPLMMEYLDISDLPSHLLREIEHFFASYKDLEHKKVQVLGWDNAAAAREEISIAMARYQEFYGRTRQEVPEIVSVKL